MPSYPFITGLKTGLKAAKKAGQKIPVFPRRMEGIRCDSGRQLLTRSFVLTFVERGRKRRGGKVWAAANVLEVGRDSDKQGHQGHDQKLHKKNDKNIT